MLKMAHSVSDISLHLVLVTKYRRDYNFNSAVLAEATASASAVLEQIGISTNHVHLLLQIDTKRPICKTVEIIKSLSSKKFRKLSGSDWHGWQNGYFISSVGRSTKSKIKKYLEEQ
jgi:REP element-mobilizing transposase RayT